MSKLYSYCKKDENKFYKELDQVIKDLHELASRLDNNDVYPSLAFIKELKASVDEIQSFAEVNLFTSEPSEEDLAYEEYLNSKTPYIIINRD